MAETDKPPCGVCKGGYKEHFDENGKPVTQHAYSAGGALETHEEVAKRQAPPTQRVSLADQVNSVPNSVGRLVEVLVLRNLLSTGDALYIAGMSSISGGPSGYRDPAQMMLPGVMG